MMTEELAPEGAHVPELPPPLTVEESNIDRVQDEIRADDKGKWDIVLPRNDTRLQDGRLIFPDCHSYDCDSGLTLSSWAMAQVCQRLSMPGSYFKRCPEALQDAQYNWWNSGLSGRRSEASAANDPTTDEFGHSSNGFGKGVLDDPQSLPAQSAYDPMEHQKGSSNGHMHSSTDGHAFKNGIYTGLDKAERWLLRAKGSTLRAVLTDRYTPLDNRMLLECLRKTLPTRLKVQWLAVDEESFHLRLFDPTLTVEVDDGDPLMAGLHIANSEVGKRSVTVDAMVYRQVCSNGMIRLMKGKSLMQQRHIAVAPAHFVAMLRQSMEQALLVSHDFLGQMEWSSREPIRDVESEMKNLATQWHMSQGFVEQVQASLQQENGRHQETLFGLVNAVTNAAQSLDADRRYDMEVLAGKLLERRSTQTHQVSKTTPATALPPSAVETAKGVFEAEPIGCEQKGNTDNADATALKAVLT